MGIMICETHGRVGFVETCSHVAKEIERKNVPVGHRLTIMGNLFVYDDCFNSLGFERLAGRPSYRWKKSFGPLMAG